MKNKLTINDIEEILFFVICLLIGVMTILSISIFAKITYIKKQFRNMENQLQEIKEIRENSEKQLEKIYKWIYELPE